MKAVPLSRFLPARIQALLRDGSPRSRAALRNILLSLITKSVTVLTSLLLVPMTIHYVNPTRYGIWMTLSSIIGWIAFFDLGLGTGFRNRFAEARAKGDEELAGAYVSTTYFAVGSVILAVFVVLMVANCFIDWPAVLRLDASYRQELQWVFGIVSGFFCLNMVVNIFSMLLTADQKPGVAAAVNGLGQLCSLGVIFLLTRFTSGSLTNLALYYSGVPCLVMLLCSVIAFRRPPYRAYAPRRSRVRLPLVRDIITLGLRFFVIYLSMLVVFQLINVVVMRELGPADVARYNVAHKYFNLLYSGSLIVITPFWSAFTDAWHRSDFGWMRSTIRKLEGFWLLTILAASLMVAISAWFYRFWVGTEVSVPAALTLSVAVYTVITVLGNMYTYMVAGLGTIGIQMTVYLVSALIAWPLLVFSCRWGVAGVLVFPSLVYLVQALLGRIQLSKLLSGKATGIWTK